MAYSGNIVDYLGSGLAAARPATPSLSPGAIGVYYATDTGDTTIWAASAWHAVSSGGGGGVFPECFGAIGNGTYDDSDAMISAVATGKHVILVAGKTYLVSKPITLAIGQHLYGNGATIKRATQTLTTTATAIISGATNSITVATGTGANFKVGQSIAVFNGANYSTQNSVITGIVGDTISLGNSLVLSSGSPWSGTTTVGLSFEVINTSDDSHIHDLIMDGNRANWSKYHWKITTEIGWAGDRAKVTNCYLHDCPGEGLQEHGLPSPNQTVGHVCENLFIYNCNGNGVHFSGSIRPLLSGYFGMNLNLDPNVGHADGGVTFSNYITDATIDKFYVNNAISGICSMDSLDNSHVSISNGVIRNCTGSAIEGQLPSGAGVTDISISNVRIYNSVSMQINQTSSGSAQFPTNWRLHNVYLEDTLLNIGNSSGVELVSVDVNWTLDTTHNPVSIRGSTDVNYVSGNITGGVDGIYLAGVNNRVKIGQGVTINGPSKAGIYSNNTGTDNVIDGPTIVLGESAVASCYGVVQNASNIVKNVTFRMDHGTGILQNGNDCITSNNTVRMTTGTSIKNYGGSAGNIAVNNFISQPVSNGGGASNTFTGNLTVPT